MKHFIQRNIIDVLSSMESAHYADLKPEELDGNQFTYHLKQLITDKLIVKNNDGTYSLTQNGRTYLVHRYEDLSKSAHTIYLLRIHSGDKLLLRTRKVQPQLGMTGFIHGEPSADDTLEESVTRRLKSKTNLDAIRVLSIGSGLIKILRNGEVSSFSHAIIVDVSVRDFLDLLTEDETGHNILIENDSLNSIDNLIPSTQFLLEYSGGWFDISYDIETI